MIYILTEMALERKIVISKIRDLQDEIVEHLMKILIYGHSNQNTNHWKMELEGWLAKCYKYKVKGGERLKAKDYFQLFYNDLIENDYEVVRLMIDSILKRNGQKEVNPITINKKMESIFKEVSEAMANNRYDFNIIEKYL
ncbi:MAG: hypothetical protein JXM74_03920 [Fusobacteriaceae bacterium]|nr:hypothetical protein [Fusobacteriaceae bacterium]